IGDWLHTLKWEAASLPPEAGRAEAAAGWFIVHGGGEFGERLAAQVKASGDECIVTRAGLEADIQPAIAGLAASGHRRVNVVYLADAEQRAGREDLSGPLCSD